MWRTTATSPVIPRWGPLTFVAVFGFTAVVGADLHMGDPQSYFWTRQAQFAAAASFVERVAMDQGCSGEVRLRGALDGLATGRMTVGRSSDGRCAAVLWMSYASGLGYGYAYAPEAQTGLVLFSEPCDRHRHRVARGRLVVGGIRGASATLSGDRRLDNSLTINRRTIAAARMTRRDCAIYR